MAVFNKKTDFTTMRRELQEAVKEFEKKYGVTVHFGNISYQDYSFTIKTTVKSDEKDSEEAERELFERHCSQYGLKNEHYKWQFDARTKKGMTKYELIGFELSRPKFCIRARNISDGTISLFTDAVVSKISSYA